VRTVTEDLLLITNTPKLSAQLGLPMHVDLIPETAALGGIYTGLSYATNNAVLCVACDMPMLQPKLLIYLVSILGQYDVVVPLVRNVGTTEPKFQTLCAVYAKRCTQIIGQMLEEGELRVHALYNRVSVRMVEPDEWQEFDSQGLSFFNINTPEDFEKANQILTYKEVEGSS